MKKTHHISPINGVLGFPLSAQMKIVSPVVERGNGQVAVCSVFSFFFFFPMRSRRSVEPENFGFWYAAHCRMFGTFGKEFRLVMCLSLHA